MPKRSNEFQALVAYLYEVAAPVGAKVTESAMLPERGNGTLREVDILVEHEVAGHAIRIAIECRDRTRQETVEWIDSLIGKSTDLPVDKIVAVTSERFSAAAFAKAAEHRIELITAEEAKAIDWAAELVKPWKGMTHSFTLMRVLAFSPDGALISETNVSQDGTRERHRDALSGIVFPTLKHMFFERFAEQVARQIEAKISDNWQQYVEDPTPRWADITVNAEADGRLKIDGVEFEIPKVIFGVATLFQVMEHEPSAFVLNKNLVQQIEPEVQGISLKFRWIINDSGQLQGAKLTAV